MEDQTDPTTDSATIEAGFTRAQARWPAWSLERDLYLSYVGARLQPGLRLQLEDLYLAAACVHGVEGALVSLEEAYMPGVDAALRPIDAAHTDEVKGMLREQLFVPRADAPPRLVEYAGRGSLGGWLQTSAVRLIYKLLAKRQRELPTEDAMLLAIADSEGEADPELALMKQHYGEEFRASLDEAWLSLSTRERNIIRHHHLDAMSIDDLGTIFWVDRSTAMRWLGKARDQLYLRTRVALAKRLKVPRGDLGSILRLINSQVAHSPIDLRKTAVPERD